MTLTDGASDGMTVLGSGAVLEVQTVLTATVLDQGPLCRVPRFESGGR